MTRLKNLLKDLFKLPSAEALAAQELDEAKRQLLQMQSTQDYARRMVDYHSDRIKRLTAYLDKNVPTLTEPA